MPYNNKPRYSYSPHHGMWRVYRNEYTKDTCTGTPIEEYLHGKRPGNEYMN